jgi:anaerobic ribonucleoside-triphosphate reductase activating protein
VSRHWGSSERSSLRVARLIDHTRVLGPGTRAVVVVQGCHLRCRGCIAAATHPLDGGEEIRIEDLGAHLLALDDIDGVTLTGGEPFLQAPALSRLLDDLRGKRPEISAMSFSGYRVEWLRTKGSPAQRRLLDRLDVLVDGPYVRRLHADLRWRGSTNQRIHALSPRHRAEIEGTGDCGAGVEFTIDEELGLEWVGVPPVPDFAARLAAHAAVER